ncbi:MAG: DNA/RNA nuclease SfsA [Chloroflexi bacterium]|nr:DNA/RNA nuclease SfsA [Chloroflexota bacterium]
MQLPHPLLEARFLRRPNRFVVIAQLNGETVSAHLPDPGRLQELLVPGAALLLAPRPEPGRRTPYQVILIRQGAVWISTDSRLPNALFREALEAGRLPGWRGYTVAQAEVPRGHSRLDFLLQGPGGATDRVWAEVKSVTLVEGGCALFPDAVTARGARHMAELMSLVEAGQRALAAFVIQRSDVACFRPQWQADPTFARALVQAAAAGVEVLACRCQVSPQTIVITETVPVDLSV